MKEQKHVPDHEILLSLRQGMGDRRLRKKYALRNQDLEAAFDRLRQSGQMTDSDVLARARLNKLVRNAWIGICLGFAVSIVGMATFVLFPVGPLLGHGILMWGCYNLAKSKGYHGALGLLALLSCFGVFLLAALPPKGSGTYWYRVLLIGATVGFLALLLAFSISIFLHQRRVLADRMAVTNLTSLQKSLGKLAEEAFQMDSKLEMDVPRIIADADALSYLVGPRYGWSGCNKQYGVLIRMVKEDGRWIIESASLNGTKPHGNNSRYVHRSPASPGGPDLPKKVVTDIVDVKDGKALHWNSYPLGDIHQEGLCYTESMVSVVGSADKRRFVILKPVGRPCKEVSPVQARPRSR